MNNQEEEQFTIESTDAPLEDFTDIVTENQPFMANNEYLQVTWRTKLIRNYIISGLLAFIAYLLAGLIIVGSLLKPNEYLVIFWFLLTCVMIFVILFFIVYYIWKWKYGTEVHLYYKYV